MSAVVLPPCAGALASLAGDGTVFASQAHEKLERLRAELEPLARRYDVVVANPPYMGSGSLAKWPSEWVKKQYPDEKSDLCTSFIERGFTLSRAHGFNAMVTMQSWMFLGSYEKMRGKILRNRSIATMAHLGTRAFGAIGGEVVSTTATVFGNGTADAAGTYFRLVDMGSEAEKREGLLEALANPDCGWFYQCESSGFKVVPGDSIAYWISSRMRNAFSKGSENTVGNLAKVAQGITTGNNDRYLRLWWEVPFGRITILREELTDGKSSYWNVCDKGGEYRKWYGNNLYVIDWRDNGSEIIESPASTPRNLGAAFKQCCTCSKISSGDISFRHHDGGYLFSDAAVSITDPVQSIHYFEGLLNCSVTLSMMRALAPTLNFEVGQIRSLPFFKNEHYYRTVNSLVRSCIEESCSDWNSFEESFEFARHPLV